MVFVEVDELFLKSKFVFVITFVNDYGKSVNNIYIYIYTVKCKALSNDFGYLFPWSLIFKKYIDTIFWNSYLSFSSFNLFVVFWPSTRPKMPFKVMHLKEVTHSNGSYERKSRMWARLIIWDKVKVPLQSDAPEKSDLWTTWQLFPLDDDQTCHSKDWVGDWVGVELLYKSVKTRSQTVGVETS